MISLRAVTGVKARAICLFGGRTADRFAGLLGMMDPDLFGGCSWASAHTRPGSIACCAEGGLQRMSFPRLGASDAGFGPRQGLREPVLRSRINQALHTELRTLGSRLCRFSQAGFGWSVSKLTETVTRGGLIEWSRRSSSKWNNVPVRWIGGPERPPQRQQLACEWHAEGAVPRNRPAWKARTVSSEASDVRTRLPPGATRSISEADSALTPIARECALPVAASGLLQPREQWSSTAGS